jgi:hypothetical protein
MESFFALLQKNVLDRHRTRGLTHSPSESTQAGAVPTLSRLFLVRV